MKSLEIRYQKYFPDNSPDRFKLIYLGLAFICLIVILSTSLLVIRNLSNKHLIYDVEKNSEKIADVLFYTEVDAISISEENSTPDIVIPATSFNALDIRIRDIFDQLEILKIVVYNNSKRIIYSTDKHLIDMIDSNNPVLDLAFDGVKRSLVRNRQTLVDLVGEKRVDADVAEVYIPIRHTTGQIMGAFCIYSDVSSQKKAYSRQLATSYRVLTASILLISLVSYIVIIRASTELKKAYRLLETMASTDALTEIFNRRELMDRADEFFAMLQRSRDKLTIGVGLGFVMIDLDHFKQVNDVYGHQAGDIVLREVAQRIGSVLRQYDVFGRYGGEEFMILVPHATAEEVGQVGLRVLEAVREQPFMAGEISIPMTASIGVTWTDARKESLDNALSRADKLLYEAKEGGRNRLMTH